MYERTFGTDWQTLESRDEAVWRGFALGVAECLGEDVPGELDRISAATASTYDRRFIELAYQKGYQRARRIKTDAAPQEVWRRLVEEQDELDLWTDPKPAFGPEPSEDADPDEETNVDETDLPPSLQGVRIDTLPSDSTERVKRPSFLDRSDSSRRERKPDGERSLFGGRSARSIARDGTDAEGDDDGRDPDA